MTPPRVLPVLAAVVPLRIALDLLWFAGPAAQLGSGVIAVVLATLVAVRWRESLGHPWRVPMALFAACLAVGVVRADSAYDAARYGLHFATPLLWLLALHAWGSDTVPRVWFAAALAATASSLGFLAAGQPADHVLHGWPRLLGAYGNLHSHAAAMAVFAATGLLFAATQRDRLAGVLGVLATVCVAATWVRSAWLWVVIAVVIALVARGRLRTVVALGVAGTLALVGVAVVRDRWADLVSVLTWTPPAGGWGALGSWRVHIWTDSFARYLEGEGWDVVLGRGLGGQYGLHRHLDPHSDWLSVLYQLGPLGLLAWLGWVGTALIAVARRAGRSDEALVALALLGGAVAMSAVSNNFVTRATPALWIWGLVGIAQNLGPRKGSES